MNLAMIKLMLGEDAAQALEEAPRLIVETGLRLAALERKIDAIFSVIVTNEKPQDYKHGTPCIDDFRAASGETITNGSFSLSDEIGDTNGSD